MRIKTHLLLLLPAAAAQLQGMRYVILLFVFNTVCYGYLRYIFLDFVGFLSMVIQVVLFYIHNV